MPKIKLETPDGVKEINCEPGTTARVAALSAGVVIGDATELEVTGCPILDGGYLLGADELYNDPSYEGVTFRVADGSDETT